ncbi:dihydroorotate dehydrogenase [Thalassovita sp.]|uniref:dihydroorotate dehydrogenase n=1 Tax=Thalassovita sp. TaxID=1979401 RepID=UPI0029DE6733|nr:dihydroorotate dehydrogenase [Thalassovita sp.]
MADMDKQTGDIDLDALFAQARGRDADPSPDFMARVLEDALAAQPAPTPVAQTRPRSSRLRQFLNAVGGWPAMAGLATAGVAGLWFGINPPEAVATTAETMLGVESDLYLVDLMPGYEFAMAEG